MINLISAYFMRKWLKYAEICGNKGRSFEFKSCQTCNKTTISIIYRFQKKHANMQKSGIFRISRHYDPFFRDS